MPTSVAGAATASQAPSGAYRPPFQYANAQVPFATVTNSPTAGATGNPDPQVQVTGVNSPGAYATAYLQSHMMSLQSYRYAYILWMIMALIAIAYAIAHHLRLSGGSLGAGYNKWGMRRHTVGPKKSRRSRALPSNSVLLIMLIVTAVVILLCVLGDDFISPNSGTFQFRKRWLFDLSSIPKYNVSKALWTTGSRFGFMGVALLPLAVLLASKAVPFGIFGFKWFTHLYADKLAIFHRALGWLIFGMITAHVALWTAQLFKDKSAYDGRVMWMGIFASQRFVFGCVSYGVLCLMMVMSLRPMRKHQYEVFYNAHVVLGILLLVTAILHHPPIFWWMALALALWAGDRLVRFIRFTRINTGKSKAQAGINEKQRYAGLATDEMALEDFTDKMVPGYGNPGTETPPQQDSPYRQTDYSSHGEVQQAGAFDQRRDQGYESSAFLPLSDPNTPLYPPQNTLGQDTRRSHMGRRSVSAASITSTQSANAMPGTGTNRAMPSEPVPIPAGYAHAQLLPSRMVRLTIRTPRPMKWAAGQGVQLTLPDLSRLQAHPFTICNSDPSEMVLLVKARKGLTLKLYNLIRQRSEQSMANIDKNVALPKAAPIYIRAQVDGPHGSSARIRWQEFSTVLIICGGSGVSFGLAICDHVCKLMAGGYFKSKTRRARFCWVAREYAELAWAASALCRAKNMVSPEQLQIDIYVTAAAPPKSYENNYDQDENGELLPPRPGYSRGMTRSSSTDSMVSMMSRDSPRPNEEDGTAQEMEAVDADMLDLTNYEDEEDAADGADNDFSRQVQKQGKLRRAKTRRQQGRASRYEGLSQGDHSPIPRPASGQYPPGMASPDPRRPSFTHPGVISNRSSSLGNLGVSSDRRSSFGHPGIISPSPSGAALPLLDDRDDAASLRPIVGQNRRVSSSSERPTSFAPDFGRADGRRSYASSMYNAYDPYAGSGGIRTGISPAPSMIFDDADSVRNTLSVMSRTQSMVFLEDTQPLDPKNKQGGMALSSALWIDEADYAATSILSESARGGRPKLLEILEEELRQAEGSLIVATCGPAKLNTVVRNLVSRRIRPGAILHGDARGHVTVFSEDFES